MLRKFPIAESVLLLLLCMASTMHGQSFGSVDGIVSDSTKAIVPGAKIALTNNETGVVTTKTTDSAGQYVFPTVLPGSYKLTATSPGFAGYSKSVVVHANDHIAVNATLIVGGSVESVDVNTATVQVDSGQRS